LYAILTLKIFSLLRCYAAYIATGVLGQPTGPIFKSQAGQW